MVLLLLLMLLGMQRTVVRMKMGMRRVRGVVPANRRSRRMERVDSMRHRLDHRERLGRNFTPTFWTSSRFGDSIATGLGLGRVLEAV
ncbi:MAG: hypothetical protein JOS17DRAFT_741989 [Linnemannia elongata]|nr:MAG: hypothetical protein JOS17DRAFT_741989 [Linnemannia elongata]